MGKIIQRLLNMASGSVAEDDLLPIQDVSVPKTKAITIANLRDALLKASAVITTAIADGAVTTRKMKPTYKQLTTPHNGTTTRTTSTSHIVVPGSVMTYTTGATNEVIQLRGYGLINNSAGGAGLIIRANGTQIGRRSYVGSSTAHQSHYPFATFEALANTTYTFDLYMLVSGSCEICNASGDVASGFGINLEMIAYGR